MYNIFSFIPRTLFHWFFQIVYLLLADESSVISEPYFNEDRNKLFVEKYTVHHRISQKNYMITS